MQVTTNNIKEQLAQAQNTFKNLSVDFESDFMMFMKTADDAAVNTGKNEYSSAGKSEDNKSDVSKDDSKSDTSDKKETTAKEKEDVSNKSASKEKDDAPVKEKKEEAVSAKSEQSSGVADKKPTNHDQEKMAEDNVVVVQQVHTEVQVKKQSIEEAPQIAGQKVQVPTVSDTSGSIAQPVIKDVAQNNIDGEKIAGQNVKTATILPKTENSGIVIDEGLTVHEEGEAIKGFQELIGKKSSPSVEAASAGVVKNIKSTGIEQVKELVNNVESAIDGMDSKTLEQAEFIEKAIGKDVKNPIKINVDVAKQETVSAPVIASETVAALNKDVEVKSNTTPVKNVNQIMGNAVDSGEANVETTQPINTILGQAAKAVREKLLNKPSGEFAKTVQAGQIETADISVGMGQSEQKISQTTSSDSEFLLMGKTYSTGKNGNAKATVMQARQENITAKQVVDQIKVQIKQTNASDKITVKLNPKELGQVELKMEVTKSGAMNIEITSNKKETLDLLRQDIKYLEKALQETVAKSESTPNFTFNLKGENNQSGEGSNSFAQRQGGGNSNENNNQQASEVVEEKEAVEYQRKGISIRV